jgi:hypothetical protein
MKCLTPISDSNLEHINKVKLDWIWNSNCGHKHLKQKMARDTSQNMVTWKTYRKVKDNIKFDLRKIGCVDGK